MNNSARQERVRALWQDMDRQNWQALSGHFIPQGEIFWQDTNERFDVNGFVRANSEYPGDWRIALLRLEETRDGDLVSVASVRMEGGPAFHVCSFFAFDEGSDKIRRLEEYWGEVGEAPAWRRELGIGAPIV